ncbi:MAG: hypothetical protein ABR540_20395, partial [Acidimicrobiales bacterium]
MHQRLSYPSPGGAVANAERNREEADRVMDDAQEAWLVARMAQGAARPGTPAQAEAAAAVNATTEALMAAMERWHQARLRAD